MDIHLRPAALHILLALAAGDAHGYAIMQRVGDRSAGRVSLGTGSLYRHLAKLIDAGLVAEVGSRRAGEDPRRGVDYRLTARGRQALEAERNRLADLLAAMDGLRAASRRGQA
jgi:DNA-binding PadR family transcriptional regulator